MVSLAFIIAFIAFILIIGLLFLGFYPSVGKLPGKEKQQEYAGRTEYYYDGCFHNQNDVKTLTREVDTKGSRLIPTDTIPVVKSDEIDDAKEGELLVTWLGHSSTLVQLGTKNVLIDPVFSKRSSPVQFAGPKRFSDLPIEPENLPQIDVLMLSHDHYDHTDYNILKIIDSKVGKYVVPLGLESYLIGWGIDENKIITVAWYDQIDVEGLKIVATPSQHFTGRNPLKVNATWWCGYYFEDDYHNVYYSGDGGYNNVFKELNDKFDSIDLALIECGQYGKGWPSSHMFPEEVVLAAQDLNAKWYIPVHWAAYCICNNDWDDSIIRFSNEADKISINYATPRIGERVNYDEIYLYNNKWWEGLN